MSAHHRTKAWARVVRIVRPAIKARLPQPCVDCGKPVYPDQRWQVGHIVSAMTGKSMGWTPDQINDPTNLGPTHAKGPGQRACNQIEGGKLGAAKTHAKRKKDRRLPTW